MKNWITNHINKIIIIFFLCGPILDLMTSLFLHVFHISLTLGTIFKILFLLLLLFDFQFNSNCRYKNKISIILYGILLYMGIFLFYVLFHKGMDVFLYECQNMVRVFFFPISLIVLYALQVENRLSIKREYFYLILFMYIILLFIPLILHTGINSYAYSKMGSTGWFHSANEIGGILSILLPFFFMEMKNKKLAIKIISCLIIGFVYFSMGTKVPILSLLFVIMGLLIYQLYLWLQKRDWKKIAFTSVSCLLLSLPIIYILPKTSFYKNIMVHLEFLEIDSVQDLLTIEHIDHFIYSQRITFLEQTMDNYMNATGTDKLLGIGYIENYGTDKVNLKTIEMDYYDIFFRHGIIGTILYFIPFIYILLCFCKKKRDIYSLLSTILILLLSLFSGHILTAPSVSIVVVMILLESIQEDLYEDRIYHD